MITTSRPLAEIAVCGTGPETGCPAEAQHRRPVRPGLPPGAPLPVAGPAAAGVGCRRDRTIRQRQVLHRLVDPGQVSSGNGQLAGNRGPPGQHDRGVVAAQLSCGDVDPGLDPAAELGPLGQHLDQAPVQVPFLHLELGDPVAQQPSGRIRALEHA